MADRPVHWHEGMFMGPQHLQAAQRYESAQRRKTARAGTRYNWGIQAMKYNQSSLANHRFEVHQLQVFLRDGTLIDLPEDGPLPDVDLRADMARTSPLTVLLGLPSFRSKGANAAANGQAGDVRYLTETQDIEDENTGTGPEPVGFRLLNARVLLTGEAQYNGYDTVPLARLIKAQDAAPRLDPKYIPPLLHCDAWPPLQIDILRYIYDLIGAKIDLLSEQMRSRGITLVSHDAEDARIAGQLRVLNEAYLVLQIIAFAEGIHPLQAYLELCRIVGQLSIFDPERLRPPELPRYDHDDLGYCFNQVKKYLEDLLRLIIEPEWKMEVFRVVLIHPDQQQDSVRTARTAESLRASVALPTMQVKVDPTFLNKPWQMFVAVESPMKRDECIALFTGRGSDKLDMKIGSSSGVSKLYAGGYRGLQFTSLSEPPRALPASPRLTYFQLAPEAQPAEWQTVLSSQLAVLINGTLVTKAEHGKSEITIRHPKQKEEMVVQLRLYAAQVKG